MDLLSFNSLQTGKRIQRVVAGTRIRALEKFQFPSNGKAYPKIQETPDLVVLMFRFQFPSNGKAYPKQAQAERIKYLEDSFNSLQTGKRIQSSSLSSLSPAAYGFNSLQTGKRIQSCVLLQLRNSSFVSFNSLQTGKRIQRAKKRNHRGGKRKFQFPSNGKAYPKTRGCWPAFHSRDRFQFPSNGKAYPKLRHSQPHQR